MSVRLCKTLLSAPAKPKVISTIYCYYHQSTVSGGSRACHWVYRRGRQSVSRGKRKRRKQKGLCEVGIKLVGFHPPRLSSSAAEGGFLLAGDLPKASLAASHGPYERINQGFTQPGTATLTSSQTKGRKKYSWGNKVRPETV